MRFFSRVLALGFASVFSLGIAPATAQSGGFEQSQLFTRMAAVNTGLHSYRARVHLDAAMSTFPFLHPALDGKALYKQPDRNAIKFDSVPAMASLFKNVFPRLAAPAQWPSLYTMTQTGDAGGITTIRLTPRREGRVERLDVTVDDASAVPTGYTFVYRDGGSIHFNQHSSKRNGFVVVDSLDGTIDLPSVKADAKANFSNYQLNAAVTDAEVSGTNS